MRKIVINPTNISEWHALVLEAQTQLGYEFDEVVQSYLVLTLDKYTTDDSIVNTVLALDFLEGMIGLDCNKICKLRNTGDRCLILSGLFPERAEKSNVSVNYYISIGRESYYLVADRRHNRYDSGLFYQLSKQFTGLTELLGAMRLVMQSPCH